MKAYTARPVSDDRYVLGECCRWDGVTNRLNWVDVFTGRLLTASWDGARLTDVATVTVPAHLTALAPHRDRDRGWVVAANQGIALLDHDGTLTWLAEPEAGGAGRIRMNDGACDPAGRFWAGSMAYDESPGAGALYRYDGEDRYTRVLGQVTISNGLAWSPDNTRMYYADTGDQTISVLDYDHATGNVTSRRTLVTVKQRGGGPDGMCIDSEGCLWVAIWGAGEVRRYTPAGEQVAVVTLDATQPTCPALGGESGHTLFITTAREGLPEELLAAQPDAGRVFATQVDVPGAAVQAWDPAAAGPARP